MTRNEKIKLKKTFFGILLLIMMVVGMISANVYTNIQNLPEDEKDEGPTWHWLRAPMVWATNQSPGAGTPGIVNIMTLADAFSDWNNPINQADANIYEDSDGTFTDNSVDAPHEELQNTTPYETDFHVAIVYQFNKSMAYDGGAWNNSRVYAMINSTGLSNDISTVTMSEGSWYAGDDANTQRLNFYVLDDDGGADDNNPLQIAIDSTYSMNVTIWYYG